VLLLEAGPADGPAAMSVPAAWLTLIGSEVDWGYATVPQAGLGGRAIVYPQGKVLGGSSSINAMAFVRGYRSALDAWEAAGGMTTCCRTTGAASTLRAATRTTAGWAGRCDRSPPQQRIRRQMPSSRLSGIGPAGALRAHGIPVAANLLGVGQNLSDHQLGGVVYSAGKPMPDGINNHGDALAALRTDPALPAPDVHILFADVPIIPPGMHGPQNGYTIRFALLNPRSRRSVRLASSDPGTAPLIDPGFLTDERDVTATLAGLRLAREIGAAQAMAEWRKEEALPGAAASTAARQHDSLRRSVGTYYHAAGTCKMGTDTAAVTDPQLRVHGIDGLRVADASVMPSLPAANTNATVLAIAERAADLITAHDL